VCHVPQETCAGGAEKAFPATRAGVKTERAYFFSPPPELEPGGAPKPSLPPSASPHANTSPSATAAVCHRPQETDVTRFPISASTSVGVARASSPANEEDVDVSVNSNSLRPTPSAPK